MQGFQAGHTSLGGRTFPPMPSTTCVWLLRRHASTQLHGTKHGTVPLSPHLAMPSTPFDWLLRRQLNTHVRGRVHHLLPQLLVLHQHLQTGKEGSVTRLPFAVYR